MRRRFVGISLAAVLGIIPEAWADASRIKDNILQKVRSSELGNHEVEVIVGRGYFPFSGEGMPKGEVRLEGTVESDEDRRFIAQVAQAQPGVAMVDNRLKVQETARAMMAPLPSNQGNLAERVSEQIEKIEPSDSYEVQVEQQGKTVVLKGTVGGEVDRERIVAAARETRGVFAVVDQITVKPPFSDEELRSRVLRALSSVDLSSVEGFALRISEGKAVFEGDANNHYVIDRILALALNVQGVSGIESRMTINGEAYAQD